MNKRYYVKAGDREKGPYTEEQLRSSYNDGLLAGGSMVREDGEEKAIPLQMVLAEASYQAAGKGVTFGAGSSGRGDDAMGNAYAPPTTSALSDMSAVDAMDRGNYWGGFALGFFGGCIALLLTTNAKPETRRGVVTGFGVGIVVGIVVRVILSVH